MPCDDRNRSCSRRCHALATLPVLAFASALVIALFLAADCAVLDNILMCRKKPPKDAYTEANQRFAAAAAVLCLLACLASS